MARVRGVRGAAAVVACTVLAGLGPQSFAGRSDTVTPVAATAAPVALGPVSVAQRPGHGCRAGLVALTFDDGPRPGTTARLVRLLRRADVPATFFEIGSHAAAHPALVRLVDRSGFPIANHTWDHPVLSRLSHHRVAAEIRRTDRTLRRIGVTLAPLVRPPYGAVNRRVRAIDRRLGLATVLWTVDSNDWRGGSAHAIAKRVLKQLRPHHRNVVLQHDGVTNSPRSVAAVPLVVRRARARGYCFAPLGRHGHPVAPTPAVTVTAVSGRTASGGPALVLRVRLTRPTTRTVGLRLVSENLTAVGGLDYTPFALAVRLAPGRTQAVVRVPVAGRTSGGPDEVPAPSFRVLVQRPRHLTLTGRSLDVQVQPDGTVTSGAPDLVLSLLPPAQLLGAGARRPAARDRR